MSGNPIGIRNAPVAHDEYDEYVNPIVMRIMQGANVDEISHYLVNIESDVMGLKADRHRARAAAKALLS